MNAIINSLLVTIVLSCVVPVHAVEGVDITADVVYGHKHGMALTFDVFKPEQKANGVGILFMVSGGWYSRWRPPENSVGWFKPMLDKGFTVFAVPHCFHAGHKRTSGVSLESIFMATAPPRDEPTITSGWCWLYSASAMRTAASKSSSGSAGLRTSWPWSRR